jgi:hypothetical protein
MADQAHYLRIETKSGRLLDKYPSEAAADAAMADVRRQLSTMDLFAPITTKSGKVMFDRDEFKSAAVTPATDDADDGLE